MEKVAKEYGVINVEDWKRVTFAKLSAQGGRGLLNRYNGSVLHLLQDTFPELDLRREKCRKTMPNGYWKEPGARRQFLDLVAKKHGVEQEEDWKRVTVQHVLDMGGSGLIDQYNGSLYAALVDVYPERNYQVGRCRRKVPQGHWHSQENRRLFMETLAREHDVKSAADWKRIGQEEVRAAGGAGLLSRYNNNVTRLILDVYPNLNGSQIVREIRQRVPKGYWGRRENRRSFLEEVARHLHVTTAEQWADVSYKQMEALGGATLLRMFDTALAAAVDSFPELDFTAVQPKRTPKHVWDSPAERRAFMDRVADKFHVEKPEDWQHVRAEDVRSSGGSGLLSRYPSMYALLEDVYANGDDAAGDDSRESWHPLLCRATAPRNYWAQEENIKDFLDRARVALRINSKEDWYRVSHEQLRSVQGGTLLSRVKLVEALRIAYPEEDWDVKSLQSSAKKSSQRQLRLVCERFFPSRRIVEDHKHELLPLNGKSLELDIYIPEMEFAIEYNGKQHYEELAFFGPLEVYQRRDQEKLRMCKEIGIRLLVIPYWWDKSDESFAASLHAEFPALVDDILVSESELGDSERSILSKVKDGSIKPIAPVVSTANSPSGCAGLAADVEGMYMAELRKGALAHWIPEEKDVASSSGRKLLSPEQWNKHLGQVSLSGTILSQE